MEKHGASTIASSLPHDVTHQCLGLAETDTRNGMKKATLLTPENMLWGVVGWPHHAQSWLATIANSLK